MNGFELFTFVEPVLPRQELCTAWPSRRLPMLSGGIGRLKQKKIFEGDSFTLVEKVDPSILGGVVVQAGDKLVDLSVSKRMQKIVSALSK